MHTRERLFLFLSLSGPPQAALLCVANAPLCSTAGRCVPVLRTHGTASRVIAINASWALSVFMQCLILAGQRRMYSLGGRELFPPFLFS